jgi:adenylate kinase family enzyme
LPDDVVSGSILESIVELEHSNLVLVDGYPRHPAAVENFRDDITSRSHRLLGTIALQVSMAISVKRIIERGERAGEIVKANTLHEFAIQRYELDFKTTNIAIEALAAFGPVEFVDASDERDAVYESFRRSVANLLASPLSKSS